MIAIFPWNFEHTCASHWEVIWQFYIFEHLNWLWECDFLLDIYEFARRGTDLVEVHVHNLKKSGHCFIRWFPDIHCCATLYSSSNISELISQSFPSQGKRFPTMFDLQSNRQDDSQCMDGVSTCKEWTVPDLLQRGTSPRRWNPWSFPWKDRFTVICLFSSTCILIHYLKIPLLHCQEPLSSFWLPFHIASICHWAEPFTWNIILNLEIKFYCLFCELITFLPSIIPPSPFPVWCDRLPGDHWASSPIFLWRRCKRCRSGSTPMKYNRVNCEYFKAWL